MRAPTEHLDYARYHEPPGEEFRLGSVRPDDTQDHPGKKLARRQLEESTKWLSSLQERLYAESERSVLLVLQAMDGGGKDSTIRRVFEGIHPQGCYVANFKAPAGEELAHDFLWRVPRGARALAGLPGGLRGGSQPLLDRARLMVRHPGREEVVPQPPGEPAPR